MLLNSRICLPQIAQVRPSPKTVSLPVRSRLSGIETGPVGHRFQAASLDLDITRFTHVLAVQPRQWSAANRTMGVFWLASKPHNTISLLLDAGQSLQLQVACRQCRRRISTYWTITYTTQSICGAANRAGLVWESVNTFRPEAIGAWAPSAVPSGPGARRSHVNSDCRVRAPDITHEFRGEVSNEITESVKRYYESMLEYEEDHEDDACYRYNLRQLERWDSIADDQC